MPCRDYELLDGATTEAIEKLQSILRSGADSFAKSRAKSRLMIVDAALNRHLSICRECQKENRRLQKSDIEGLGR